MHTRTKRAIAIAIVLTPLQLSAVLPCPLIMTGHLRQAHAYAPEGVRTLLKAIATLVRILGRVGRPTAVIARMYAYYAIRIHPCHDGRFPLTEYQPSGYGRVLNCGRQLPRARKQKTNCAQDVHDELAIAVLIISSICRILRSNPAGARSRRPLADTWVAIKTPFERRKQSVGVHSVRTRILGTAPRPPSREYRTCTARTLEDEQATSVVKR